MKLSKKTKNALLSYSRAFVGAAVAVFLAAGGDLWAVDGDLLKAMISAGVGALIPVVVRWANPNDPAFGRGSGGGAGVSKVA